MIDKKKAVFNWSGGKDSALALYKTLEDGKFEVVSLLTTINEETLKSSIHSIPLDILKMQAESMGISLYTVLFSKDLSDYDEKMHETVDYFKTMHVTHFIFGDIFLSDIKAYRESKLNPLGIEVVEPLWGKTSKEVMDEFLQSGIRSKIIVTQADQLDQTYIGKELNANLVNSLPEHVDVCGENGEYHTLSFAGGMYKKEIEFVLSEYSKVAYTMKLGNGQSKTFEYWQAEILS